MALALPGARDKAAVVQAMFDRIAPRYDLMNAVLTMRRDRAWRRAALAAAVVGPGTRVVDVACGTGDLVELAARRGAHVVGVDFASGMLEIAGRRGMTGRLVRGDALALPLPGGSADAITCAFALRNFVAIAPFLAEAVRVLRPGGRIALLEVGVPRSRLLAAAHRVYFHHAVPWIGGVLAERAAYAYLPASVEYLPDAERLAHAMEAAGFTDVRRRLLTLGAAQLVWARRAAAPGGAR